MGSPPAVEAEVYPFFIPRLKPGVYLLPNCTTTAPSTSMESFWRSDKIRLVHPMPETIRRKTPTVLIGNVRVGSDAPVVVQSMTNTDTADVPSTVLQVAALHRAGSEIVRVTVNNDEAAKAVPYIVDALAKQDVHVPIVGDFHYNGHLLLKKYPDCARALAKYRINPGNSDIGKEEKNNFAAMIDVALKFNKPIRIGANWGSLDKVMLARKMDENARAGNPL